MVRKQKENLVEKKNVKKGSSHRLYAPAHRKRRLACGVIGVANPEWAATVFG